MKRIFTVTNTGFLYGLSHLVLKWRGFKEENNLITFYTKVVDDLDEFLFDNDIKDDDIVIFIGFNEPIEERITNLYGKYTGFKFFNNSDETNPFFELVKKVESKSLTPKRKKMIKYGLDWIKMDFKYKESYMLSILYKELGHNEFMKAFKNGYSEDIIENYTKYIHRHLKKFKKEKSDVLTVNGFYFVSSTIKFIDDFMFLNIPKYGNITIIDVNKGRVYMRKKDECEKDILNFAEKFLDRVVGYKNLCSGDITERFGKLVKKMEGVA